MASVKSNRINIKKPVYCLLTTDTPSGTTYGAVKPFGEPMQVQITPQMSTGVLYGGGKKQEDIGKIKGYAVAFDVNKLFSEVKAEIMGHTVTDGVVIVKDGDEAPYLAFGYEVEQTNGTKEQIWFLKGRAQPANQTIQQSADNINFSTDSITMNFIPRDSDERISWFGDTANSSYTSTQADAFFATGPVSFPTATP